MTGGGTIFAMSYHGANEVIENYGMGPVKAALDRSVRSGGDLDPSPRACDHPGPLATRAASSTSRFRR